jgi:hypothetical protein
VTTNDVQGSISREIGPEHGIFDSHRAADSSSWRRQTLPIQEPLPGRPNGGSTKGE